MTESIEKLCAELDSLNDKVAETRSFVTSLTLQLGAAKQGVAEWEHYATLEVLAKLGGYKTGEPASTANDKVLGANAETRARTLFLEMERIYNNDTEPSDVETYFNAKEKQQKIEADLAALQDKLRAYEDMAQAIRWKLRVHIADRLAENPVSREVLPF